MDGVRVAAAANVTDKRIDRHGCIDFRIEGWENIRFDRGKDSAQIQGVSLNCMLHASFLLLGFSKELCVLPGGTAAWDVLMEPFFTTLSSQVTIYELMSRVEFLSREVMDLERSEGYVRDLMTFMYNANILFGALKFVYTWIANFNSYVTEKHLTILRGAVFEIGSLGLNNLSITNVSPDHLPYLCCYRDMYIRLEVLLDVVTSERSRLTLGLRQSVSLSPYHYPNLHLLHYNNHHYDAAVTHFASLRNKKHFQYAYQTRDFRSANVHVLPLPSLKVIKGDFGAQAFDPALRKESLKDMVTKAKFKLDIFGADNLLDDDSDEESKDLAKETIAEPTVQRGQPRIKTGMSLLNSPCIRLDEDESSAATTAPLPLSSGLASNQGIVKAGNFASRNTSAGGNAAAPTTLTLLNKTKDIWDFDILEVARQMTLIDHAMFCTIPLYSLLQNRWSESRHSRTSLEMRRFTDRFNAISLFATTSILSKDSVEQRSACYTNFVILANYLINIGNYNSAMAVLSALQQGSVTRLSQTISQVSEKHVDTLSDIQRRMSPVKNYAAYKNEIAQRAVYLHDDSDWRHRTDGIDCRLRRFHGNTVKPMQSDAEKSKSSSISPDLTSADRTEAFVPYLGAHLAELIGIFDGNPDSLPEAPHMMNMYKKILVARSLALLSRMQRLSYNIEPIRMLGAIINRSFKPNIRYLSKDGIESNRALYDRSVYLEPAGRTGGSGPDGYSGYGEPTPPSPMRSQGSSMSQPSSSAAALPAEQQPRERSMLSSSSTSISSKLPVESSSSFTANQSSSSSSSSSGVLRMVTTKVAVVPNANSTSDKGKVLEKSSSMKSFFGFGKKTDDQGDEDDDESGDEEESGEDDESGEEEESQEGEEKSKGGFFGFFKKKKKPESDDEDEEEEEDDDEDDDDESEESSESQQESKSKGSGFNLFGKKK